MLTFAVQVACLLVPLLVRILGVDPVIHISAVHLVLLCTQAAFVVVIVNLVVVFVVLVKVVDQLTVMHTEMKVVFVLHEVEPLDEKRDSLDVVVNSSLMVGLVICSSAGSLVKMGICTSVRNSLMSSFVEGLGDSFVIGDTSAGKLMMVGMVLVNGLALMVEENDGQEVGMWQ